MPVITISRTTGCRGTEIGRLLAKRLGYAYVDREIILKIMNEYGYKNFALTYQGEKVVKSLFSFIGEHKNQANNLTESLSFLNQVMEAIASLNKVVLVGRGGFRLLAEYDDVCNVRLDADFENRIHSVTEREGLSFEQARDKVIEKDRIHTNFIRYYNHFGMDANHFHYVLDTGLVQTEHIVNLLYEAVSNITERLTIRHSVENIQPEEKLKQYTLDVVNQLGYQYEQT